MRWVLSLALMAALAVLAATVLGQNEGLVTLYGMGWRVDLSLNFFLLLWLLTVAVAILVIKAIESLSTLPQKARVWRLQGRERAAQKSLRDAFVLYWGGRYTRAAKDAEKAIAAGLATEDGRPDLDFIMLSQLMVAACAHEVSDKGRRDAALAQMAAVAGKGSASPAQEAAGLLKAKWLLEDREAEAALTHLNALPGGLARRVRALRLRLQAAQMARQPMEALRTARTLIKHKVFSDGAAQALRRTLAIEHLDLPRDASGVAQVWVTLEAPERGDVWVASRAATRLSELGGPSGAAQARQWLKPFWESAGAHSAAGRLALGVALMHARDGMETEWLALIEQSSEHFAQEPAYALALGFALLQCGQGAKAREHLEQAASAAELPVGARRMAWLALAQQAREQGDMPRSQLAFEEAAHLP